jgi:hypothetical protein
MSTVAKATTATATAPSTSGMLFIGAAGGAAVPAPKNVLSSGVGAPAWLPLHTSVCQAPLPAERR